MMNRTGDLENRAPSADSASRLSAGPATNAARQRLATALVVACRLRQNGDTERTTELRGTVASYMAALRGEGATVEQAVIATKELVSSTIGSPNIPPELRSLAEQVVSWGIDAYYNDADGRAD